MLVDAVFSLFPPSAMTALVLVIKTGLFPLLLLVVAAILLLLLLPRVLLLLLRIGSCIVD